MFLELKNTDIGYKTPLIKACSASLNLGQVCLLIGNNGVGKTTLIKSILSQIPVLAGEISLEGKSVSKLTTKEIAEKIAVVFSKANVPQHFSVYDLVSLGKYIHYPYYFELNRIDKLHVDEIIDNLNLSQFRNLPIIQLSDGNLQKAFIGRALAQNSSFIILDEPTTHLDEENKIMILKTLRELSQNHNKLILFSSHDWRLGKRFSDKIWYIKDQQLHNGIAEDLLSVHSELLHPKILDFNGDFVAPAIISSEFHKELLHSFLQKNFNLDLSFLKFVHTNGFWNISNQNFEQKANSFEEILEILSNLHQ